MNLSLDETWKLCLKQWEWIAEQACLERGKVNVTALKHQWVNDHGFGLTKTGVACFFCEYAGTADTRLCKGKCPARLVEPNFDCMNKQYHYSNRPIQFYHKLLELNERRLKMKDMIQIDGKEFSIDTVKYALQKTCGVQFEKKEKETYPLVSIASFRENDNRIIVRLNKTTIAYIERHKPSYIAMNVNGSICGESNTYNLAEHYTNEKPIFGKISD